MLWVCPSLEVYTDASSNWLCGETTEVGPINCHINTCTHVSLHVINLTDWRVRQPLGRPLLVRLACRLARGDKCQQVSSSCCCFHVVIEKHCSDEVTFVRQPLRKLFSRGKCIKLIYIWRSLPSIFWWPLGVTRRHKSLPSERAAPAVALHFNLMLLISSPCAENFTPPT